MRIPAKKPLWIVGAGRLGRRVGALWRSSGGGRVVAETRTDQNHPALQQLGLEPSRRDTRAQISVPNVLFCVPPSQSGNDYTQEVERAVALWDGSGNLVFVSSTAVYAEQDGGEVYEDSALATHGRAEVLLKAEDVVLQAGGKVVRLAGLYDDQSGPHRAYAKQSTSAARGDGWINLIHREDAAALCVKVLLASTSSSVFLGCDRQPLTRNQIQDLWLKRAALEKTPFTPCRFLGTDPDRGKRCNAQRTEEELGWSPRWKSFADFV